MKIIYDKAEDKKNKRNTIRGIFTLFVVIITIRIIDTETNIYDFSSIEKLIFSFGVMVLLLIGSLVLIRLLRFEDDNEEIAVKKMKENIHDEYKKAKLEYRLNKLKEKNG